MWMYHSHTDEVGDAYAGLMGPIDRSPRRGKARAGRHARTTSTGSSSLHFKVMNENNSPYLEQQHRQLRGQAGRR